MNEVEANIHLVTWDLPETEAEGMAAAILKNIEVHPRDRHLVMVTRRQFGYWLRDHISRLKSDLKLELGFSEGFLESWAAREAFILFCLLMDPDRPTWRAWLGYKNSSNGNDFQAPNRNAGAYLQLLASANDFISDATIEALAAEQRDKARGAGGLAIWDRASRFIELRKKFQRNGEDGAEFVNGFYDPQYRVGTDYDEEKAEGAKNDLNLLRERTLALYHEEKDANHDAEAKECLRSVTTHMRYQIATNEPLSGAEPGDLSVITL